MNGFVSFLFMLLRDALRPHVVCPDEMAPIYPAVAHEYPFGGKSHMACKPCKLASAHV